MDTSRMKKAGTREEVYKGLALRTAGGLKREDIIEKQFGTRTLYISKKLSDKMRVNFNINRENNPNYLKRTLNSKRTLVAPKNPDAHHIILEQKKKILPKTQKLSFRVKENTVRNVFYPEEAEEDRGLHLPPKKESTNQFSIEEMPDIDIMTLD
jgi:hypothetical protein